MMGTNYMHQIKISGFAVYSPRKITFLSNEYVEQIKEVASKIDNNYLRKNINLLQKSIKDNSSVAIGKAKELLETTLKYIAEERNVEIQKNPSLTNLDKEVRQNLKLDANKR